MKAVCLALAVAAACAAPSLRALPVVKIPVDADQSPIKDLRDSTCGPNMGYAGCLAEVSLYNDPFSVWAYGAGLAQTEKALVACGAKLLRQCNALEEWQRGMAKSWNRANPKAYFSLWKKLGIKVLLVIECYGVYTDTTFTKRSNHPDVLRQAVRDFVGWIVRNKFEDVVAGFEMGNEPYFGNEPEIYAIRVETVMPEILKIMPKAKIGIPVAEYRAGDPDLAVVRKRLGEKKMMAGGGHFEINRLNQWSGRFVTALSNQIDRVSHVIYHFYGAERAYGAGAAGFERVHTFAKIYPQLADKRVWVTEWRERSDEDDRCHQAHFSTLWKAHYSLLALAQPNVDGFALHCIGSLAGALNIAMNCSTGPGQPWVPGFCFQSDPLGGFHFSPDPDGGRGIHRYELGPTAPLYRMYTDALAGHPVLLEHGGVNGWGEKGPRWASVLYYESGKQQRLAVMRGAKELPQIMGNVEWLAALDPGRTSVAVLMVNTLDEPAEAQFSSLRGRFAGPVKVKTLTCPAAYTYSYNVPGEPPLWSVAERRADASGDRASVEIPARAVQVVTLGLAK